MDNETIDIDQLIACEYCDALFTRPELSEGEAAKCTRCGSTIIERKVDSIERSFYLSIAGILLMFPAIVLPIMGVTLVGQYHNASLLDSILALIDRGFYMIAILVFMFAIAVPAVRLLGAFYLSFCFKFNRLKPSLLHFFRAFHHLDSWAMLNVFMLGIIVSMYKLLDDTELSVNIGLLAFILWFVCSTVVSLVLDQDYIWLKLEERFPSKKLNEQHDENS